MDSGLDRRGQPCKLYWISKSKEIIELCLDWHQVLVDLSWKAGNGVLQNWLNENPVGTLGNIFILAQAHSLPRYSCSCHKRKLDKES